MLYRAENISVFVEGCNFKIKCPKKLRPAGDYCHLKVSTLKVKNNFKIYIKINVKTALTCFAAVTPSSESALLMLAKVTVVKTGN